MDRPGPAPYRFPPPAARPATATADRSFVVAMVAVIGMLFSVAVVGVGYSVVHRGALAVPAPAAPPVVRTSTSEPGAAPRRTPPAAPRRTPGASPSVDQVFLGTMRQRAVFAGAGATDLYALGGAICAQLDRGRSFTAVVADGGGRNLGPEDMGYLTGVSVMAYCPRHKPMLEQLIGRTLPGI
jgi:hypothetical protein